MTSLVVLKAWGACSDQASHLKRRRVTKDNVAPSEHARTSHCGLKDVEKECVIRTRRLLERSPATFARPPPYRPRPFAPSHDPHMLVRRPQVRSRPKLGNPP